MSRVVTVNSGLRFNLVRDEVSTYPLLQCGACDCWLSFTQEQYQGDRALTCECGWTAPQHFGGELEAFSTSHKLTQTPIKFEELDRRKAGLDCAGKSPHTLGDHGRAEGTDCGDA